MKTKTFACRYPGCEYTAHAPQPRGRHESLKHGMHHGLLNGNHADRAEVKAELSATKAAIQELESAIAKLDSRRDELLTAMAVMRSLESNDRP